MRSATSEPPPRQRRRRPRSDRARRLPRSRRRSARIQAPIRGRRSARRRLDGTTEVSSDAMPLDRTSVRCAEQSLERRADMTEPGGDQTRVPSDAGRNAGPDEHEALPRRREPGRGGARTDEGDRARKRQGRRVCSGRREAAHDPGRLRVGEGRIALDRPRRSAGAPYRGGGVGARARSGSSGSTAERDGVVKARIQRSARISSLKGCSSRCTVRPANRRPSIGHADRAGPQAELAAGVDKPIHQGLDDAARAGESGCRPGGSSPSVRDPRVLAARARRPRRACGDPRRRGARRCAGVLDLTAGSTERSASQASSSA